MTGKSNLTLATGLSLTREHNLKHWRSFVHGLTLTCGLTLVQERTLGSGLGFALERTLKHGHTFVRGLTLTRSLTLTQGLALASVFALSMATNSASARYQDSRQARYSPAFMPGSVVNPTMDPKNVPDFATGGAPAAGQAGSSGRITAPDGSLFGTQLGSQSGASGGTALRADAASTTLPVQTRLRLVLETAVDAKNSQPGDIFEAHVKDDLFVGTVLLLPKSSLVRGRVAEVTKPRLLSRAAKIGLKLEQIVTPAGEVIPLDAALEFQKGLTNKTGQLDPGTSFGTRVENNLKSVTGMNSTGTARGALIAANVATLGAPAIATAIGGSAIAIFRAGDNVSLTPGQEIEVQLTNDLGLQLN